MKEKSRSVKRILIVLLFAAMAIFLTACGVDVDATVKLNRDGSGERIMVLTMPKNEMLLLYAAVFFVRRLSEQTEYILQEKSGSDG